MAGLTMLPVLMYHGLHRDAHSHGRFDPVYSVRPDDFARQLDWLQANGYRSMHLDDVALDTAADSQTLLISFDDGDASNIEVALPLLRARGMSAEFFITSDFIDRPGMLTSTDVRALADAGMGIGAHGCSHAFLEDLEPAALTAELRDSRHRLRVLTGGAVNALALPGGRGGERELHAAQALGYRYLFGSVPGPNHRPRRDAWLQRLAVTRDTTLPEFAALVRWRGLRPRLLRARFAALALPKRVLGNTGYARLRERLL
ncbi:polysaccharide deacetylase family protein [Lysobacter cavernae]|uniref:Polysaccharide deacetylase family protein n=1 Tax=Lysobacter cavernae TaxID=1685901 RepID=A0ABV7RMG0_9GAMM